MGWRNGLKHMGEAKCQAFAGFAQFDARGAPDNAGTAFLGVRSLQKLAQRLGRRRLTDPNVLGGR